MEAVERFTAVVAASSDDVRVDIAAFCIAAVAHPQLDIDEQCARLDSLARDCPAPTFDALRRFLFTTLGYAGNTDDYGDPENSFMDSVIDRRLGIPITLSLLTMEVGRRVGVVVHGVGMPGHFLVQEASQPDVWCDPFHGGALYDREACRTLFRRIHGGRARFTAELLRPVGAHTILARMLTNLEQGRIATDPARLMSFCELHLALPNLADAERDRLRALVRSTRARWN
jgi:regulator of sirC expression with transglutaminase-like and TPR domain